MWEDLYLDTVDEDFTTSVTTPVDLSEWVSRPPDVPEVARVWGASTGTQNRKLFEEMEPGDYILFYRIGEGEYVGTGKIQAKCEAEWMAEEYWEESNSDRKLLYVISDFDRSVSPVKEVNELLGYADIYHPHGLQRVTDDRVSPSLLSKFNLE